MPKTSNQPSQKEMELVILRLTAVSPELHFSSGDNAQSFSRDAMIKQIKDNTEVGKEFVVIEFEFLRAIKDGSLKKILVNTTDS